VNKKHLLTFAQIAAVLAASILLSSFAFALSPQTLSDDLAYYRRTSSEKNLDSNGRSYILSRIKDKYLHTNVNLAPLRAEEKRISATAGPTDDKTKEVASVAVSTAWAEKVLVSETPRESRITIIAHGVSRHNYFLLRDPDQGQQPKIVVDLFNTQDRLSSRAKDIVLRKGLFSRVTSGQFDPTTVRIVAQLRRDTPYRVLNENDRWFIIAEKQSPSAVSAVAKAQPLPALPVNPVPVTPAVYGEAAKKSSGAPVAAQLPQTAPITVKGPLSSLDKATTAAYRIETADILGITVSPADELSREVVVQFDGTIPFPLIGTANAKGLTPRQLEDNLKQSLARFISNPQITVTIKQFSRRQIFVTGEVHSVGSFSFRENLRLMEFISSLGGFNDNANRREIKVYRGSTDKRNVITVNVEETIRSGDFSKDFLLQPGDIVEVPEGRLRIAILGDVRNPGYLDYKENMQLLELISQVGGFTETAQIAKISILREEKNGEKKVTFVNLKDILSGKSPDVPVRHGDTVYVPRRGIATANWFLSNIMPWLSLISLVLVIGRV